MHFYQYVINFYHDYKISSESEYNSKKNNITIV